MKGSLTSIFRFREEGVKGVIYHFDLVILTELGCRNALVGDCVVNTSTGQVSMRIDQTLPLSSNEKSILMDDIFEQAKDIEENIYS